jgi:hypothetical protein
MNGVTNRIIVTDGLCCACSIDTVQVHHENFPEMQVEGRSAEEAVDILSDRLTAALDSVSDHVHRGAILSALADVRTFRLREGNARRVHEKPSTSAR